MFPGVFDTVGIPVVPNPVGTGVTPLVLATTPERTAPRRLLQDRQTTATSSGVIGRPAAFAAHASALWSTVRSSLPSQSEHHG